MVRPYKVPAREGIQAVRVTAHLVVVVTNCGNPHLSPLPHSSQWFATCWVGGAAGR